MALSKPIYNLLGIYFEKLYTNPVLTKSLTAATLSLGANYIAQRISGDDLDYNSLVAYGAFGLVFGGTCPHYFYSFIEKVTKNMKNRKMMQFLMQRFMYTPIFTVISLYFLSLFEGATPDQAQRKMLALYKKVLTANWTYLTIPVYVNFKYVHPMMRVLVTNLIGVFWTIYLAQKRKAAAKKRSSSSEKNEF
ncbi:PXMP2/4 family protein 3 [Culicoides brevitarsis]|uniref:PXMP2/4 family protein 3 n=1 Tax=Culicoides brevitarsis TaxID=469753 RepID=UPI00307BC5A0